MNLLIINTAGEESYVSLYKESQMIGRKSWPAEVKAGLKLIGSIDDLLKETGVAVEDIGRIAVHGGPGSRSSSLRVGVVVASVLSLTRGAELVNISGETQKEAVEQAMDKVAVTAINIEYKERGYGQNRKKEKK